MFYVHSMCNQVRKCSKLLHECLLYIRIVNSQAGGGRGLGHAPHSAAPAACEPCLRQGVVLCQITAAHCSNAYR